jgi:ketosteroid isomerase-like protein
MPTPLTLPKPIADYFAAEAKEDAAALARCFAEDGVVKDEGHTFRGPAAIRKWNADARNKYHHRVEPLRATERDGRTVVVARVSGSFPGSPLELDHVFRLEGEKIGTLEIG